MPTVPLLDSEAETRLEEIGSADVLVGIPSFNNARTVGHVVRAVQYGLAKYFPQERAVILNSDGRSEDDTRRVVRETSVYSNIDSLLIRHPVRPCAVVSGAYEGIPGKGSAFRAIFEAARRLGVKACVMVDSDLRSITPEWIEMLAGPVLLKNYDFVCPSYARHKYDGTITNMAVYPLTRALYGKRVRQPIGGDFGLSGAMAAHLADQNVWDTDVARFGIDIWMTTTALVSGRRICQGFLGAKVHDAKDPAKNLGPMFSQVMSTLLALARNNVDAWASVRGSQPTPMFGFKSEIAPVPVEVSVPAMVDRFREGAAKAAPVWKRALSPETLQGVESAAAHPDPFVFPAELWVRVLYETTVAYGQAELSPSGSATRAAILDALVPLYFGRTAGYAIETKDMTTAEAELIVERQCAKFEELKYTLVERWKERVGG
ncbi:MAG TPA: glycosyl transferase family 2 [Candidatus Thermoplasmatota archaeon]|nr:glycosyl transferase family 2 [Candidatus Thermoplasmatota archaeon]